MRASSSLPRSVFLPFVAGLMHAVLMACAFPPIGLWPLVALAPLPLVWPALSSRKWSPVLVGLGVAPLWAYEQIWVIDVSRLGYLPLVAGLATFSMLFVWALRRTVRRWPRAPLTALVPLVWVGVEVFRGEVAFDGYPWMLLPHPIIESHVLALPAALLGVYFVGFLVATLSGAAADVIVYGRARARGATAGVAAAALVWLLAPVAAPLGPPGPGPLRIAVVQTDIPQDNKNEWKPEARRRDFDRFLALTRQAAASEPRPALIVWPETMFPGITLDPWLAERIDENVAQGKGKDDARAVAPMYRELLEFQRGLGIPLLVGATGFDEDSAAPSGLAFFNSAFLIERGRVDPVRFDKLKLTPFGEVMPYIELWPWLQQRLLALGASGMEFNLRRGTGARVFEIATESGPVTIGTPICFEGTTADVNRALVRVAADRPQVLINLTNDGWFGRFDAGKWQHLQNARWRCVELGVPMVRAANTGVSCSIDGRGRLLKAGIEGSERKTNVDGVLLADVAPARARTVYTAVGRLFAWLTFAGAICLLLGTYVRTGGSLR
jgi:apolipoprotein N-acyltransferase